MNTQDADALKSTASDNKEQISQPTPLSHLSPAWEREGPSLKSAVVTIWQVLRHPVRTFSAPGLPGRKSATTFGVLLLSFELSFFLISTQPFEGNVVSRLIFIALALVLIPLLAWGNLYLGAGVTQVLLDWTKSGASDFQRTYRVVAYTSGVLAPFSLIPLLGTLLVMTLGSVVYLHALAAAHGVLKRKVLPSLLVSYLLLFFLYFILSDSPQKAFMDFLM